MSTQSNQQEAYNSNPPPHTVFGLKQDTQRLRYEERFPEDPCCQETAPNARVWRTYEEEAAAYDAVMVGQSRDGLDVMLVFVCSHSFLFICMD